MKHQIVLALVAVLPAVAVAEPLLRDRGCVACHAPDRRLVGPAWQEIQKRSAGQPGERERLTQKIRRGGSGVWGPIPMPAQNLTDAEIQRVLDHILAQPRG